MKKIITLTLMAIVLTLFFSGAGVVSARTTDKRSEAQAVLNSLAANLTARGYVVIYKTLTINEAPYDFYAARVGISRIPSKIDAMQSGKRAIKLLTLPYVQRQVFYAPIESPNGGYEVDVTWCFVGDVCSQW